MSEQENIDGRGSCKVCGVAIIEKVTNVVVTGNRDERHLLGKREGRDIDETKILAYFRCLLRETNKKCRF